MNSTIRPLAHLSLLSCALVTSACFDLGGNGRALSPFTKITADQLGGAAPALDQQKMWVKVTAGTKNLTVHSVKVPGTSLTDPTDVGLPCTITVSGSATDMVCIAEVEELDLYFNGIDIQYNIPGTTCNYARVAPYWYFRYQVGQGLPYIDEYHDLASNPPVFTVSDTISPVVLRATVAGEEAYSLLKCPNDYTPFGGPNCCLGSYTHVTRTAQAGGLPDNKTTELGKPWGGDAGRCVDGPGADTTVFQRHLVYKTPIPVYRNIELAGTSGDIVGGSPYKKLFRTNIFLANFFGLADHGAAGAVPQPLNPIIFTDPNLFSATPSDSYEFQCLDRSSSLKHRIKLYVREWNEATELQKFTAGQNANSDTTTNNVNDFQDWKDMAPGAPTPPIYPQNRQ